MTSSADTITLTIPRSVVPELPSLAKGLNDRMHELPERNAEGMLAETERAELETLAQMAQIVQILAMLGRGQRILEPLVNSSDVAGGSACDERDQPALRSSVSDDARPSVVVPPG